MFQWYGQKCCVGIGSTLDFVYFDCAYNRRKRCLGASPTHLLGFDMNRAYDSENALGAFETQQQIIPGHNQKQQI